MATYRIKEILSAKGLTQKWLAGKLRMSEAEVSRLIKRDALNDDTQQRVADALGVRRCELFSDFIDGSITLTCPTCGTQIEINVKN